MRFLGYNLLALETVLPIVDVPAYSCGWYRLADPLKPRHTLNKAGDHLMRTGPLIEVKLRTNADCDDSRG